MRRPAPTAHGQARHREEPQSGCNQDQQHPGAGEQGGEHSTTGVGFAAVAELRTARPLPRLPLQGTGGEVGLHGVDALAAPPLERRQRRL